MKALPVVSIVASGERVQALVDTGCSQTIVAQRLARNVTNGAGRIMTVNGSSVSCAGTTMVQLGVGERKLVVHGLVLERMVPGVDVILGMDVITQLGGVTVKMGGATPRAQFGVVCCAVPPRRSQLVQIEEKDFWADFDGDHWTVGWRWKAEAPDMRRGASCYKIPGDVQEEFDKEVQSWIDEGIIVPTHDSSGHILPLMAVRQENKGKVRPVLDYRELNEHILSFTGDSAVCDETLRRWRREGVNVQMLDLRKAYLQLHVDESLWKYQLVSFKGRIYHLTRLGFGLCSAPRIMSHILGKVLSLDPRIREATGFYLDDIIVNEDMVSAEQVSEHLSKYGLVAKPPQKLENSRVLGLQLKKEEGGDIGWSRGNTLPEVTFPITRRQLFSACGQLVGHYPVANWLRIACSYVKRQSEGSKWDDPIGTRAELLLNDLLSQVALEDPVSGKWSVGRESKSGRVWCDASSIGLGVVLEIDDHVVEDAAWLRKKDDAMHINVAELEAVVKGLNLALKWNLEKLKIMTDSATVFGWLQSALTGSHRVKTHGTAEMLVRRRLSLVSELKKEYSVSMSVELVRSSVNKADSLTRVRKQWMQQPVNNATCCVSSVESVRAVHNTHHLGVNPTFYHAQLVNPLTTRKDAEEVVRSCSRCQSIDPAPVRWKHGTLETDCNWERLACDITHYGKTLFLTVVDSGPSRFAIWRELPSEDARNVVGQMEQIFLEHGVPKEILTDNGMSFRSKAMKDLCRRWGVLQSFRCAYRPEGNAIVERNHRTIKRMAARANGSPVEMVHWYNATPKNDHDPNSAPSAALFTYQWKSTQRRFGSRTDPDLLPIHGTVPLRIGESVYVKPPSTRCTTSWPMGTVTGINSSRNIEVNGVPRHISDVRSADIERNEEVEENGESEDEELVEGETRINEGDEVNGANAEEEEGPVGRQRPLRVRRPPRWLSDYHVNL
jgi:transposase InsO family protein